MDVYKNNRSLWNVLILILKSCACVCACMCAFHSHLSDGLWQTGGYFSQPLPPAVHYVITAGTQLRTLQYTTGRMRLGS